MAEGISTPCNEAPQIKTCSKCRETNPVSSFGLTRTVGGRRLLRGVCRVCYNIQRRSHYSRPEVKVIKRAKRKEYERKIGFADKRKIQRLDPAVKAKEKAASVRYRSKPEVRAFRRLQASIFLVA